MKITIIGTGYVGLVTGACLADVGNEVLCLDLDVKKIDLLNGGGIPIYEAGLESLVVRNRANDRLKFTTDIDMAVSFGELQIIAVGTPPDEDGSADLKYVISAARNIGKRMTEYKLIIDKSTVPVGTGDKVRAAILDELSKRNRQDLEFGVVSNPEFLKEGAAVSDFMKPDRVIVGAEEERAIEIMRTLYAPFQRNHERIVLMSVRSAELTKYAANAMLATRISFMNELANVAEKIGADIEMVRKGIGADPRVGYHFLYPGSGYGGSCFPKDVKALVHTAKQDAEIDLRVLQAVEAANDAQKHVLANKIFARLGSDLRGRNFAIWGLAFKPNTDDMREAASRVLIADLLNAGATITAYDPAAVAEAQRIYVNEPRVRFSTSPYSALDEADALAIVTEWQEFRSPSFELIKKKLKVPVIFDGRNLYDPSSVGEAGIEYHCIGRQFLKFEAQ